MTEQQISEFNSLYQLACDKMKGLIILEDYRPKALGFFEKSRAKKAIRYFEQALAIFPDHWQSLFLLGKLYQRFGDYDKSLSYFENSLELEQTNHSIPQEASIVAMHLNQINKAIKYSEESLRRKPNDFALLGNHSMNLLIAGQDNEAIESINKAIAINPDDEINQRIKAKIEGVIAGHIKRPTFESSLG
jgi:tetratricopeptide (TPR) repeat protein